MEENKQNKIEESVLIYDCETKVFGKPDPEKDLLKLFGCYSYKTKKTYVLTKTEDIQKVINAHKYLVGFNNKFYDNPILIRAGIDLQFKYIIDLKIIFEERAGVMKIKEGMLGDLLMHYSLDYISKTIGIVNEETGKQEIDYNWFKKDIWTENETTIIMDYTKRDIEVTKKMYEWVEEYFEPLKEFLNEEDVKGKKYLTDTTAVFAYKVICKELGLKPEFDSNVEHITYGGGYVAYPCAEEVKGKQAYFDFVSLYPNLMLQNNLFQHHCKCCEQHEKWHGDGFFKVDGYYCSKKQGQIEELLKKLFLLRKEYKKNKDKREYTIKIIINIFYGICGNPIFKHFYNRSGASDCTSLGRQCIKYVRKIFRENGYINVMADTDSNVVLIPQGKTIEDAKQLVSECCKELQKHMPFPWDEFGMKLEDEIKYFFFFKGRNKEEDDLSELDEDCKINMHKKLMKKNYIYVTKDNKLVIKNLGIRKKSNSMLSRKIFNDYLVPQIIEQGVVKFSKTYLKNLITKLLQEDITLAAMRHDVGDYEQYRESSPTGLPAQIAKKYGSGIYMMIPNLKNIGVGKGKSYATLEEFKLNNLTIDDVDLSNVFKELEYFTKEVKTKNIFEF